MSRTEHHGDNAKRRRFGRNWRWLQTTPSWWTRLMMNRPQRRAVKLWERDTAKSNDMEAVDKPPHGKKPHWYFW